ncbi:MAG: hypothetical protein ABI266_09000 [Ginsengibacter sp.]
MKRNSLNLSVTLFVVAAVFSFAISGCKKKGGDVMLPPIDGYQTAGDVAKANLMGYWNFDGNSNETISSTAPTTSSKSSYVTGVKGQAVRLDSGYILYPTIAALSATNLGSATVSVWIMTENQGDGSKPTSVFALTLGATMQTDWNVGPINMYLENGRPKNYNDTLVLHSSMSTYGSGGRLGGDNINDYGVRATDFKTVLGANKWVQYVFRYDGAGSFLDIFANGELVSNNNFRFKYFGDAPKVPLGNLILPAGTQTQVVLGGFPNASTGFAQSPVQAFQGLYRGDIDEMRFYNKSLTDAEISALYKLESAGR